MDGKKIGLCSARSVSLYHEILKYLFGLPLKLADITNNPPIPMFQSNPRKSQASSEEFAIDPREIDKVLSELAGMVGRWHLFKKFLSEDLKVPYIFLLQLD
jgi:COG4 transport protein